MNLAEVVAETQTHLKSEPPPNESCTCEWVILPLLRACGYAIREIYSRIADNNGQYPDYTILPDDAQNTWYLEAKAWNVSLEDKHAQQSLNYANHNGKRFVVLTNGRVWRLYDNAIQGLVQEKMIAQAQLADTLDIIAFLNRLNRNSVILGQLENTAAKARLRIILEQQIFEPTRNIVFGIRTTLRRDDTLRRVRGEDIVACLRDILSATPTTLDSVSIPTTEPKSATPTIVVGKTEKVSVVPQGRISPVTGMTNLQELVNKVQKEGYQAVANTKPTKAIFPDGTQWNGGDWADFAEAFVKWTCKQDKLPSLPFSGIERGKNYLLNSTDYHSDNSKMNACRIIRYGINNIFLFTNLSAESFVKRLHGLCLAAKLRPTDIRLKLS